MSLIQKRAASCQREAKVYFLAMSTVLEIKTATEQLSPQERWQLFRWLEASSDVRRFRREELQQDIALGLGQAELGETAPLDVAALKDEVRQKLKAKRTR